MTTTTKTHTIQGALNEANPNELADALRKVNVGDMLQGLRKTITGLTAAAAIDITTVTDPDDTAKKLPAILSVLALRVTAVGTAATGPRQVTDAGGTPLAPPTATAYAGASVGLVTLSANGKTLTFEGTVTGFVIYYIPKQDLTAQFEKL